MPIRLAFLNLHGMVPAHERNVRELPPASEDLRLWVRVMLLLNVAFLVTVFVIAAWLNPYDADGAPLRMASHTQLGMAPCNFVVLFNRPCPTCGMTTSFALLMHGDLPASLAANSSGTLLALGLLLFIPWSLLASLRGRWPLRRWVELYVVWGLIATIGLAIVRWTIVVGVPWARGLS